MWQFGILVTTSYLSQQAYQELTNDRHSVIVISASYVAEILVNAGLGTPEAVKQWLIAQFPPLVKKEAKPTVIDYLSQQIRGVDYHAGWTYAEHGFRSSHAEGAGRQPDREGRKRRRRVSEVPGTPRRELPRWSRDA